MNINYLIRKFYYTSKFYFFFCVTQIIFSLALIIYISLDMRINLRKFPVICCEYISKRLKFPGFRVICGGFRITMFKLGKRAFGTCQIMHSDLEIRGYLES